MKKLILINGTMGVGKTTLCQELYRKLNAAVWLDGDWCWKMHPFVVSEENKMMVQDNIKYLLSNYLKNSSFTYIIFSWVIHRDDIFELILNDLQEFDFELYKITLICSEEALTKRMEDGGRKPDGIKKSIERLALYEKMNTLQIDTTHLTISNTMEHVLKIINENGLKP